jgi:L-iditol 2-dehydrogenase
MFYKMAAAIGLRRKHTMKAVYKVRAGKDGWEIRDIPRREPGENEVEIQIAAAGICGSELHLYHDNHFYTPPALIGHEWSGRINKVGSNVKNWKVGDKVVVYNSRGACGQCYFCRKGQTIFCPNRNTSPYGNKDNGGWREYFTMDTSALLKVPDHVTYAEAAMIEPLAITTHALCLKSPIVTGETVLVQGCGTIGMLAAMVAKASGAGKVILVGRKSARAVRIPVAKKLGMIDLIVDSSQTDLKEVIMELTEGRGADVVVDCAGSEQAINDSISLVRRSGRIIAIGEPPASTVNVKWIDAIVKDLSIVFTFGYLDEAWMIALKLLAEGKVNMKPMITHKLPLEKFEEGFKLMDEKIAVKVILLPNGEMD